MTLGFPEQNSLPRGRRSRDCLWLPWQEGMSPLFEVRMELGEEGLTFNPSLEVGANQGFLELLEGLVNDIYNAAKLIPRLAKGKFSYKVKLSAGLTHPAPHPAL